MKNMLILNILMLVANYLSAQNYSFNASTSGQRVCLVSSEVDLNNLNTKIFFLDSANNVNGAIYINRRALGTTTWTSVAAALPASTGHWIDNNVNLGEVWEYQIKRLNTWNFQSVNYDAIGYTIGSLLIDNTNYKGQMILLVSDDILNNLPTKYLRLKKELTADGWFVNEIIATRAANWDSGSQVVGIKNQIKSIYATAPVNDKPKILFILGHIALPRSGSTQVTAPDEHDENKGARGCDAYYADIDGIYTDTATFNPGGLATTLAINLPGDYKWDQDFMSSDIEMAFGRVDFADLTDIIISETAMMEQYLDRLSQYKNVANGFKMGDKSAFYFGYDNSNDGSFRSLPNISTNNNVYNNTNPNHNQWVQSTGPYKIYMQNVSVPEITDWQTFGMNATVFSSDQSYWGFGDVPQSGVYSRIRSLLGVPSKCLVTLWTTTGINIFHQACTGMPLSLAMKEIMNHNDVNKKLEKAPQAYDTPDWWNRTHFAFYGDPTLNLYQIEPPTDIAINDSSGNAVLTWVNSLDSNIEGYHIYESTSELGRYNRITTLPITGTKFVIPNYLKNTWYMVKAVKNITSGCGQFSHSSLGVSIQGLFTPLAIEDNSSNQQIQLMPNPFVNEFFITANDKIESIEVYNFLGEKMISNDNLQKNNFKVDCASFKNGLYIVKVMIKGNAYTFKITK